MSQPYPPPYPSQQPSPYPQQGWSDPRAPIPEQTHLGSWAPQAPGHLSQPPAGLPQYGRPYGQEQYGQEQYGRPPYGGYPQGPPQGRPPQVNGMGITALVLALVGLALSWIPFVGILSILLGSAAVVVGMIGWNRARQGRAGLALPVAGAAVGIVAIVVGIISTSLGVQLFGDQLDGTSAAPPSSAVPSPSDPSASAPSASDPSAADPPAGDGSTTALPGSFAWEDGVSIEVGAPQRVTFSDTATAAGAAGVAFEVRIVNGSSEVLEPFALLASLTADGAAAEQVFDYGDGGFTAPTNSIPPGRELTYTMAFEAAGGDLLLEFGSYDRDPAFFAATG